MSENELDELVKSSAPIMLNDITDDAYIVNNRSYTRVTRALSIIAKYELLLWYGKNGTKKCKEIQQLRKKYGTKMHMFYGKAVIGETVSDSDVEDAMKMEFTPDIIEEAKESLHCFKDWVGNRNITPIKVEHHVISREHGYGGTVDIIAKIGDRTYIGDWKTSSSIYPEHILQIGAYYNALKEQDGIDADGGFIASIRNGVVKDVFVDKPTLILAHSHFLNALSLYTMKRDKIFGV